MNRSLVVLLAFSSLLVADQAGAQPGFPAIVDSTLGLKLETAEPSMGCQLCHTSDQGNTTSLRPFGEMMVSLRADLEHGRKQSLGRLLGQRAQGAGK